MLQVAVEAKDLFRHHAIFLHQAGKGFFQHFDITWRNIMGNLQPTALEHCVLAWQRWRAHTRESPSQREGLTWEQALFKPSEGAMAHYVGVRSGGGVTAAAGATAGLSRCTTALGLDFPFDIAAITGWSAKLQSHTVQPQIPIEVAELVHFDDHAKYNRTLSCTLFVPPSGFHF